MDITYEIASSIFDKLSNIVDIPIYISNKAGKIIVGSDNNLVGLTVREAKIAATTNDHVTLSDTVPFDLIGLACPICYLDECVGSAIITGKPAHYEPYLHFIKFTIEMLLERSFNISHGMNEQKLQKEWVMNLFDPEYCEWSELEREAETLGINTSKEAVVIVIQISGLSNSNVSPSHNLSFFENIILQNTNHRIEINYSCYLGNNLYVYSVSQKTAVAGSNTIFRDELRNALQGLIQRISTINASCRIGIGDVGNDVRSYRCSLMQAKKSIELSRQLKHAYPIMQIYDWGLMYFLSLISQDVLNVLLTQYLSQAGNMKTELIQTVESFFQNNCAVQKTADLLNIHKNTLLYRLKRVKEICGLNPQKFEDAVVLQLLLYLQKLYPDLITETSGQQLNDN